MGIIDIAKENVGERRFPSLKKLSDDEVLELIQALASGEIDDFGARKALQSCGYSKSIASSTAILGPRIIRMVMNGIVKIVKM